MIRTDAFASDLCKVLRHAGLTFEAEHRQKNVDGCVDVKGVDIKGHTRVLIEIELRRYAPVGNVIKVWRRLINRNCPNDVVLIQVFSGFYATKSRAKAHAVFIGQKCQKNSKTFTTFRSRSITNLAPGSLTHQ